MVNEAINSHWNKEKSSNEFELQSKVDETMDKILTLVVNSQKINAAVEGNEKKQAETENNRTTSHKNVTMWNVKK